MLRLSWIHDVFDSAVVCRDALVLFRGESSSSSCVMAVTSVPSYLLVS
jgi:hypothetical protein